MHYRLPRRGFKLENMRVLLLVGILCAARASASVVLLGWTPVPPLPQFVPQGYTLGFDITPFDFPSDLTLFWFNQPKFYIRSKESLNPSSLPYSFTFNQEPQVSVTHTPEPSTWLLAASALFALFSILDWRRRKLDALQLWSRWQKQIQKNQPATFRQVFVFPQTRTRR